MIIELNFHDLARLAAQSEVVKGDITIKINSPILPMINTHPADSDEYIVFSLDSSDPRSKAYAWDALKQK